MRLICPNCGAQYEVAGDVIPAAGRDVQCSNCGHTWLETPGSSVAAEEAIDVAETVSVSNTVETGSAAVKETAKTGFGGSIEDAFADLDTNEQSADLPDTVDHFESAEGEAPPTTAPQRRAVDPAVASILQEEAALEAAARQADTSGALDSQADLGLDTVAEQARPTRPEPTEPVVETREAANQAAVAATVTAAGSRRELLPDIEEINSSLRSNAERGESPISEPEEIIAEKRRGFGFGFVITLLIVAFLAALYVLAPELTLAVPDIADPLVTYVEWVDAGRIWVDIKANQLLDMMRPAVDAVPES